MWFVWCGFFSGKYAAKHSDVEALLAKFSFFKCLYAFLQRGACRLWLMFVPTWYILRGKRISVVVSLDLKDANTIVYGDYFRNAGRMRLPNLWKSFTPRLPYDNYLVISVASGTDIAKQTVAMVQGCPLQLAYRTCGNGASG